MNTQRILIVGTGGHAKVVTDICRTSDTGGRLLIVAYRDAVDEDEVRSFLGRPAFGRRWFDRAVFDRVIVAVGDNADRKSEFTRFLEQGCEFESAIHPSAVLSGESSMGRGVMICAGAVVNPFTTVGDNVILNTRCSVDHDCEIGHHVHIAPGVTLGGGVAVGEGTLIGIGATVKPGVTIGAWAIVGAGAVVVRDVPDGEVHVGVPARRR